MLKRHLSISLVLLANLMVLVHAVVPHSHGSNGYVYFTSLKTCFHFEYGSASSADNHGHTDTPAHDAGCYSLKHNLVLPSNEHSSKAFLDVLLQNSLDNSLLGFVVQPINLSRYYRVERVAIPVAVGCWRIFLMSSALLRAPPIVQSNS